MIHRAPFGSMERFVAVLLEHTGGNLPLWLCPDQIIILPISEKFSNFAAEILNSLEDKGFRVASDNRNEKIGKKIRDAEMAKIPYMVIIGEKEMNDRILSVRRHGRGDLGSISVDDFVSMLNQEIESEISK
jgi:threonyl-tRNA synthetase